MSEGTRSTAAAQLTVAAYRRLNTLTDEFRRRIKALAAELAEGSGSVTPARIDQAAEELATSDWIRELDSRHECSAHAA